MRVDEVSQKGAGLDLIAEADAVDDTVRMWQDGDDFPWLLIDPTARAVYVGDGTAAPATDLSDVGSGSGTDLSEVGTYTEDLSGWGEPGFTDPAHVDESRGWIAFDTDNGSEFVAGYGSAAEKTAGISVNSTSQVMEVASADADIQAYISDANGAQVKIKAKPAQAFRQLELQNGSSVVFWGVESTGQMVMGEISAPAGAPPANVAWLWVEDNGAGKTRLVARFPSGADQVIATQP